MKIFSRSKSAATYKTGDHSLEARVCLVDTIHEMEINIEVDMDSQTITRAHSVIIRAPYTFCHEIADRAKYLVDFKINEKGVASRARHLLGGPRGCFQLEDLALEAIKAVNQSISAFMPGDKKTLLAQFDQKLHGTCHSHCYSLEEKISGSSVSLIKR